LRVQGLGSSVDHVILLSCTRLRNYDFAFSVQGLVCRVQCLGFMFEVTVQQET